jgi:hypothetical protein
LLPFLKERGHDRAVDAVASVATVATPARNHNKRALFELKLLHQMRRASNMARLRATPKFNFTKKEMYPSGQENFR